LEGNRKRKRIKKKERPIVNVMYFSFWAAILIMFAALFFSQMESYNELQAQLALANANVAREKAENDRLELQLTFFDIDDYVEQLARERLGMVRPNEIVFRNIAD